MRLPAQTKVIPCFVCARIQFQHPLELRERLSDAALLIVDAAQHIGALLIPYVLLEKSDESGNRSLNIAEQVFSICSYFQRTRIIRSEFQGCAGSVSRFGEPAAQ